MEIDDRDLSDLHALEKALADLEENKNRVILNEFVMYRDLFVQDTMQRLSKKEIINLSASFVKRFNPYKPIEVVDQKGELLFRVPQIFIPIKDVASDYVALVNRFRAEGVSEIPKYAAEATQGILAAILKSQEDVSKEGYENYGEYIRALSKAYQRDMELFEKFKEESHVQETERATKDTIENLQGLSWD